MPALNRYGRTIAASLAYDMRKAFEGEAELDRPQLPTQADVGAAHNLTPRQVRHYLAKYGHPSTPEPRFRFSPDVMADIEARREAGERWSSIREAIAYPGPVSALRKGVSYQRRKARGGMCRESGCQSKATRGARCDHHAARVAENAAKVRALYKE